jgi:branched-chain amino acid transport system substrate-binding protein
MVAYAHMNLPGPLNQIVRDYKKKFNDDMYTGSIYHAYTMLSEAFVKAKSTDPVKVAAVMEGMKFNSFNGEVEMRKTDHQLQQACSFPSVEKAGAKYPIDYSGEHGLQLRARQVPYEPYVASTPTSCQMKRPGG